MLQNLQINFKNDWLEIFVRITRDNKDRVTVIYMFILETKIEFKEIIYL